MTLKKFLFSSYTFASDFTRNLLLVITYMIKGDLGIRSFIKYSNSFITNAILPISVIAIALGVVLAVQLGPEFNAKGMGNQLGILAAITLTRELIPIVGSFMLATQYGTSFAAELANMKITQQIDALKVFEVDPVSYLVLPRFLSMTLFAPVILWLACIISVISCYLTVWFKYDASFTGYLSTILDYFKVGDILLCFVKAAIFGGIIILTSATVGLTTVGGAKEVGKSATRSVILSFIFIVIMDYIITSIYL